MAEGHVLGAQRAVEQATDVVPAGAEVELRHAMVRRNDRREGVLQGLEALYPRLQGVAAFRERAGVGDVGVLLQVADRDLPHLRREVDEIAVVGNPVVIHVPGKARPQGLHVLQRCTVALVLGDRVFRHVFQVQLARIADRKSTRLNSSHGYISYAVFCLKKKKKQRSTLTYSLY